MGERRGRDDEAKERISYYTPIFGPGTYFFTGPDDSAQGGPIPDGYWIRVGNALSLNSYRRRVCVWVLDIRNSPPRDDEVDHHILPEETILSAFPINIIVGNTIWIDKNIFLHRRKKP